MNDQLNVRISSETTLNIKTLTNILKQQIYDSNYFDGQLVFGDHLVPKFPELWALKTPEKNLSQKTCPDLNWNPGPLRERRVHIFFQGNLIRNNVY